MKKILIIRGWRSNAKHWQKSKKIFESEGFEVLAPDLPGFKKDLKLDKPWTIDDYKDWFLEYTKEKGWESFNVLGHSFGGAIAAKISVATPEKVEKLILSAPAVAGIKSPKSVFFYLVAKTIKPFFLLPFLKKSFPSTKKKLSSFGIKEYYFEEGVMEKTFTNLAKEDFREILSKVRIETLILWGGEDNKISVKHAQKIKEKIQKSKIIIFPDTKHQPHLEIPEEFSKEVIKFIK